MRYRLAWCLSLRSRPGPRGGLRVEVDVELTPAGGVEALLPPGGKRLLHARRRPAQDLRSQVVARGGVGMRGGASDGGGLCAEACQHLVARHPRGQQLARAGRAEEHLLGNHEGGEEEGRG